MDLTIDFAKTVNFLIISLAFVTGLSVFFVFYWCLLLFVSLIVIQFLLRTILLSRIIYAIVLQSLQPHGFVVFLPAANYRQ